MLSSEQTLELLKQQVDEQYENKSKWYQVRSRSKWMEQGEKSTSYFLDLEKARQGHIASHATGAKLFFIHSFYLYHILFITYTSQLYFYATHLLNNTFTQKNTNHTI